MEKQIEYFENLIGKSLSGHISKEEQTELNNWLKVDEVNQKLYSDYVKIWEKSRKPFSKQEIHADLDLVKDNISRKLQNLQLVYKRRQFIYRIAAVIAIPVLIAFGWYVGNFMGSSNSNNQLCEVIAPKGQIAECTLPDGSKVWLNSGTTIKYNPSFKGKIRNVYLNGEAYFEVTKNKHRPFIVNASEVNVKVLGTSFNVRAFSEEKIVEAVLEEGSIELSFDGISKDNHILKPGDHAVFTKSDKSLNVEKVETYALTSWRDGQYIFKDADLRTIINKLENIYDVKIYLTNPEMEDLHFRGMFDYNQSVFEALETLEKTTTLKYKIEGKKIWLE